MEERMIELERKLKEITKTQDELKNALASGKIQLLLDMVFLTILSSYLIKRPAIGRKTNRF